MAGMSTIAALSLSTAIWPAVHLAVFWLRFNKLPPGGWADSLVFAPMGLVSAAIALFLCSRTDAPRRRRNVFLGYLLASPLAFAGSLFGGLFLPGIWGPLLLGAGPLAIGSSIGFMLGKRD